MNTSYNPGIESIDQPRNPDGIALLESINVPHPNKRGGDKPTSLYELLDVDAARQRLDAAAGEGTAVYEQATVDEAQRIARTVSSALWFSPGRVKGNEVSPPSFNRLNGDQVANCYGYTYVAAESMRAVGIKHWVASANGHVFLVVPAGQSAYLVDPLSPGLSGSLAQHTPAGSFADMDERLQKEGRQAVVLDTRRFEDSDHPGESIGRLAQRYPWLAPAKAHDAMDGFRHSGSKLIMSIFPEESGRSMLTNHVSFQRALADGNPNEALASLSQMSGEWPDADARNAYNHRKIRSLVKAMCREGNFTGACQAIEAYYESFSGLNDPRFPFEEAECLRIVARSVGEVLGSLALDGVGEEREQEAASLLFVGEMARVGAAYRYEEAQRRHYAATSPSKPPRFSEITQLKLATVTGH